MSYSLRKTDGDAGVYISTVCVSVFVNPCAFDMPTVYLRHVNHLSMSYWTPCVEKVQLVEPYSAFHESQSMK